MAIATACLVVAKQKGALDLTPSEADSGRRQPCFLVTKSTESIAIDDLSLSAPTGPARDSRNDDQGWRVTGV